MKFEEAVFDDLIRCYRDRNYRFDFSTESLYLDAFDKGIYIQIKTMYQADFADYMKNEPTFFDKHLPLEAKLFNSLYLEFMNNYCNRNYKNKKTRYAMQIKILYPKKLKDASAKKRFIRQFVLNICGLKEALPYFVENQKQGHGNYALITVIDRLYLGRKQWMIYKKDIWLDQRTGKFAEKDCPQEYKILKCSAGEYKLDVNGKRIPSQAIFSNSLQNFSYTQDKETGRNKWNEFIGSLRQKFMNAVLYVCGKSDFVKKGKRLHKTECKPQYHRYVRRRIAALNFAKQTIEYTTNYLLGRFSKEDIIYCPYNEGKSKRVIHSENYKKITSIFFKYKKRFQNAQYHDSQGQVMRLDYYHQNVYDLDQAIQSLLDMWFAEIGTLDFT